jgi:hypothetical protein
MKSTHRRNVLQPSYQSFSPQAKPMLYVEKITNFQQQKGESIPKAWERLQEYISDCPHHGIKDWVLLQSFYHGLNQKASEHIDAAAKGSFLSLTTRQANTLI